MERVIRTRCATCGSVIGIHTSGEGTSSFGQLNRLFVNEDRTVLVRFWSDGQVEVAQRGSSQQVWGPSVPLKEEIE